MALQLSVAARNTRLDAFETAAGATAILRIRSGAQPATCATADSGTILAAMTLPADYMSNAATGSKAKLGTWQAASAAAAGTAGHFRFYDSAGTTCHMQGSVTLTSGGGDMEIDNTNIAAGQVAQEPSPIPDLVVRPMARSFERLVCEVYVDDVLFSGYLQAALQQLQVLRRQFRC